MNFFDFLFSLNILVADWFGFLEDINKFYLSKFKIDQFDISTEIHVELFELKADLLKAKKKKGNGGLKGMQQWWIDVRMWKKLTDTGTEEFISGFENLPF